MDNKKDLELDPINVCQVCGYTVDGEALEKRPVCNSPKERFKAF